MRRRIAAASAAMMVHDDVAWLDEEEPFAARPAQIRPAVEIDALQAFGEGIGAGAEAEGGASSLIGGAYFLGGLAAGEDKGDEGKGGETGNGHR